MERLDLFSKERAVRGAKVGAVVSLAMVGVGALISGVGTEVLHPGSLGTVFEFAYDHPTEVLEAVGLYTAYWATIGATLDSFRPTSRLAERFIKDQVETYKTTKEIFKEIKNGNENAYYFLRQFDFSRIPFNLTRLDQSALRRRLIITVPTHGALAGTVLWGIFKISNIAESIIFSKRDLVTQTIADHPIETVGAMAAVGLVVASSMLAFQED